MTKAASDVESTNPKPNSSPAAQTQPQAPPQAPGKPEAAPALVWEHETGARIVREVQVSGYFAAILPDPSIEPISAKLAMEGYLKDAGDSKDPIERMLIEQMVIAHHRLAQLQVKAHEATNTEFIKVLNAAAVRLMGEIRRFALSIRQYRMPPGQKQFDPIKEQHTQVTPEAPEPPELPKATLPKRSELNGRFDWSMDGFGRDWLSAEQEAELLEAAGVVRGRLPAAT